MSADSEDSGEGGFSGWSRVLIWRANVGVVDYRATRTVKNSHKLCEQKRDRE